jgi:hypothetical protein
MSQEPTIQHPRSIYPGRHNLYLRPDRPAARLSTGRRRGRCGSADRAWDISIQLQSERIKR